MRGDVTPPSISGPLQKKVLVLGIVRKVDLQEAACRDAISDALAMILLDIAVYLY